MAGGRGGGDRAVSVGHGGTAGTVAAGRADGVPLAQQPNPTYPQ